MRNEINTRKKRFWAVFLTVMLLLNQLPPMLGKAAETYDMVDLWEDQILASGDILWNHSDVSCTVTYYDDGDFIGEAIETVNIDPNTSHQLVEYSPPEGFIFTGWTVSSIQIASGGIVEAISFRATIAIDGTKINGSLYQETLSEGTVIYSENDTYTITYYDQNGEILIDEQTIDINTAYTVKEYPGTEPEGYSFTGWLVSDVYGSGGTGYINLKAQLNVNQYKITFNIDGGSAIDSITQDFGTAVTAPADPVKIGYTFAGWDPKIPETMPAENITIKALWTVNKYTIRFVNEDGTQLQGSEVAYGETPAYTGETPTKAATAEYTYTFAGWTPEIAEVTGEATYTATYTETANSYTITFDTDGGNEIAPIIQDFGTEVTAPADPTRTGYTFSGWDPEIPGTMPAENMIIKALWTANRYTITFDTDGGSAIDPVTQDFGTAVTIPANPTKTGYTFTTWDQEIPTTMPAENMTIKALWTENAYTITFDTSGGSSIAPITQAYGTTVTPPADPTRTGYTFVNWNPAIPATMPAENITVLARWIANEYTITFNTDGGSAIDSITQDFGTAVTAPADPVKTGYTFAGWDKTIPATMPAEDVTITARWTANRYNVSYALNGGTNGNNPGTYTYGTGVAVLADGVKPGYLFAGWFETADFSGEAVTSIAADRTGDVTLYAKFEMGAIEAGTYSLTAGVPYKLGDVTKVSGDSSVYVSGSIFYVSASGSYTFS